jgi:hypothetical protein
MEWLTAMRPHGLFQYVLRLPEKAYLKFLKTTVEETLFSRLGTIVEETRVANIQMEETIIEQCSKLLLDHPQFLLGTLW